MKIHNQKIDHGESTFVIAEAGLNHNGDIKMARKLIDAALNAGADAIKFQTFQTEKFVTKTNQYFDLFKNAELSYDEFRELNEYANNKEIVFFSAPFDLESVDYLNKINVPCFKIASSDLTNIPLISKIAKTKKPIIISTGLAVMNEIEDAVNTCYYEGNNQIALLHCLASYPTPYNEVNLNAINVMRKKFEVPIGYSDNGEPSLVDLAAVSLGACIIEKHFTLDKNLSGPDHSFSIDPEGLKKLIREIRMIEEMKGNGIKMPQPSEIEGRIAIRKSITAKHDLQKGEIINDESLLVKRPEGGIEPRYLSRILGKKTNKIIKEDSLVRWEDIE